jgi:hypothetical protein
VYAALYEKGASETEPRELHAPAVLAPPTAAALAGKGAFVAGDAALRVVPPPIGARGAELVPRARDALRLGLARCVETGRLDDERTVLPLYLRPSEAELLWERRRNEESAESRGTQ